MRSAANGGIVECSGENPTNPVGGGIDVVHPVAPEDGELRVRAHDTVEEGEHDEEEREDIGNYGE